MTGPLIGHPISEIYGRFFPGNELILLRDRVIPETLDMRSNPSQLGILVRVYGLQSWRKLLAVREKSRLLTSLIGLFMLGYAWLAFAIFHKGLGFIGRFPALGSMLTERLIFLLFATLFVLLLFSNLVISYTNLFRNKETQFLMSLPLSFKTIYRWKFIESTILASWAFIFLIAPLLAAYGLTINARWDFYFTTTLLTGLFIILPAVAGSWCAIQIGRFLDRKSFQIAALVAVGLLLLFGLSWLKTEEVTETMLETRVMDVLDRLLKKTEFAQFPFLPSFWLSTGVLHWAEGAIASAKFYSVVLLANVAFFGFLAFTQFGNIFYDGASMVHSRGSFLNRWEWFRNWQSKRRGFHYRRGLVERFVNAFRFLRRDARAVMIKDILMFWRDTSQWGQTLVLFGLLSVYVMNLRHFSSQLSNPFWIHLVAYLNLGACSLNLATLTTRFVYPQFSLEGKRVWIVGLAPLGLHRVVRAKYILACSGSLIVTVSLMAMSSHMLKMPIERTLYFIGAIGIMTFTLNGLAIGLGTLYPNFKEENPSKIVSGFGGTFCLVLSFLYIVLSVVLLATGSPWGVRTTPPPTRVLLFSGLFLLVSAFLGGLPMFMGRKKLRDFEI